ncbi:MAG: NAD(P)-dependent oxidoreductase [Parvularculaceae bacterium]|nr:NAD(P)-dependent oxidoreductase [Parvularculaceae bacterium]
MTLSGIALIGFGEVGQILAEDLATVNNAAISAYDIKFEEAVSGPAQAIKKSKAKKAQTSTDCVSNADIVICAVTAASTVEAAHAARGALRKSAWYLDLNSSSPAAKKEAAAIINSGGGRYVEAAVMAPIEPLRLGAPILLGGAHAQDFEPLAASLGFVGAKFYSATPGKTAAAKLCRSVVVKGLEALISESMLAAQHYGVEEDVLASLNNLFPHPDWRSHARYMISRTLKHGRRRAEEMQEAARTVSDAGIEPWMANATVMRQANAGNLSVDESISELDGLLRAMRDSDSADHKPLETAL